MKELELIKGCAARNSKAQEELFRRYGAKLKSIAYRYSNDREDANDIFQEAFMRVLKDIHMVKNPLLLEAWMRRVYINTAMSFYRKKKKGVLSGYDFSDHENELNVTQNGIEEELETEYIVSIERFDQHELLQLIDTLGKPQSLIFKMYYVDDIPHKEIGEILGITESNCRVLLYRSKTKLRKMLTTILNQTVNK